MDDAFLVRRVECVGNLPRVVQRRRERHRASGRVAVDQLHHEIVGTDVVQRADVGMVQRRHRTRFALRALGELLGRHLDGNFSSDATVERAIASPMPPSPSLATI